MQRLRILPGSSLNGLKPGAQGAGAVCLWHGTTTRKEVCDHEGGVVWGEKLYSNFSSLPYRWKLSGAQRSYHQATTEESQALIYNSTIKKTLDKSSIGMEKVKRFDMSKVFPGVPAPKPASAFEVPKTLISALPNGLRVASEETYGQLCTIGIIVDVGSRYETEEYTGLSQLMEKMAFKSTFSKTHEEVLQAIDSMGGTFQASVSREQLLFCVDVMRDYLPNAMELLAECVLAPRLTDQEVREQGEVMKIMHEEQEPEAMLLENLHAAAYRGQPLGRPMMCPAERIPMLDSRLLHEYRARFFQGPRMVLAGAGVEHSEFTALAAKCFSGLPPEAHGDGKVVMEPSKYIGDREVTKKDFIHMELQQKPLVHVCVAFEVGGWSDPSLVPACVLQMLLGGGQSFSAGGPGKGMYTRLYREVLNRCYWVESAEAMTSFNAETGLLGISGSAPPEYAGQLTGVLCQHFAMLASEKVSQTELDRAKKMLKCNVLTHLESRQVLFEDIGRQLLTYGYRETPEQVCDRIDKVTADDIMEVVQEAFRKPPTLAAVGPQVDAVPSLQDVTEWFKSRVGKR
ncbi:unnamed protein product [Chrysoparadoxa australica]